MPRITGSGNPLRIPTNRETNTPYALAGEAHWSEWVDVPVREHRTIWSIPLSALGLEVQLPEGVSAPLCKQSNRPEYYLVTFDPNYLKERFYREWVQPLCWSPATVQQFFNINQQWISDRIEYFKKNELREQAAQMASVDPKRRGVEFWFQQLVALDEDEHPKTNNNNVLPFMGKLEKLGNEFFVFVVETGQRLKVDKAKVVNVATKNDANIAYLTSQRQKVRFSIDEKRGVPSGTRKAVGWVLELAIEE